ncbi:MAG: ATP-binding protein [Ornithinimicrobium sp.]
MTLLRAAQEALNNVRRHASASRIRITVSYMGDVVVLDVQDDGVGMEHADPSPGGGFGLTAMRERVDDQGGSVDVECEPGEGTTVAVTLPTFALPTGDT